MLFCDETCIAGAHSWQKINAAKPPVLARTEYDDINEKRNQWNLLMG